MFDRLGNRTDLTPVKTVIPSSNVIVRKLDDGITTVSEETSLAIAKHVTRMNGKPAKVYPPLKQRGVKPFAGVKPELTDRMPRTPHVTGHNKIPASLLTVFEKLTMGGPGFRVRKRAGRVAAARLSQWLTQQRLHGRAIVQYWDDGDMVFWVDPDF